MSRSRLRGALALRRVFAGMALFSLVCALTGIGCVDVVTLEYEEYRQPLDDHTELAVSTYPAWYPKESVSLAPVYIRLQHDAYVALQFHVRARSGSARTGPANTTVHVQRLAYRLDDRPETVVLKDFRGDFWMQNTGSFQDRTKYGIPYREHSLLRFTADLTVNGKRISMAGAMPARRHLSRYPIVLHYFWR